MRSSTDTHLYHLIICNYVYGYGLERKNNKNSHILFSFTYKHDSFQNKTIYIQ